MKIIVNVPVAVTITDDNIRYEESIVGSDIARAFYNICESNHDECSQLCPVFKANGNKVPWVKNVVGYEECECFRSGSKMLSFIKSKIK